MLHLQEYHQSCLEHVIEEVIEVWHSFLMYRGEYPQWEQVDDLRAAVTGSVAFDVESEKIAYRLDVIGAV